MSKKIKACPYCGKMPKIYKFNGRNFYGCNNDECYMAAFDCTVTKSIWNTRPIEDELQKRIAELEAEVTKGHELQDSYCDRIAELEEENALLKQHPQPIEFWSDEKKEIYRRNESRTIKSGGEEERER